MSRVSTAVVLRSVRLQLFVRVRNIEYSPGITFCLKLEQTFQTYAYNIAVGRNPSDL